MEKYKKLIENNIFISPMTKVISQGVGQAIAEPPFEASNTNFATFNIKLTDSEYKVYLITDNSILTGAILNYKAKSLIVIEPNPVHVFLSTSIDAYKTLNSIDNSLINFADNPNTVNEATEVFHEYVKGSSTAIIFLFTSLEAFINSLFEEDFTLSLERKKCTEVYNKEQIEQYLIFEEKFKEGIPKVTGKFFHKEYGADYSKILELKKLRDKLIHVKYHKDDTENYYRIFYNELLQMKYVDYCCSIINFMNYIKPYFIQFNKL